MWTAKTKDADQTVRMHRLSSAGTKPKSLDVSHRRLISMEK